MGIRNAVFCAAMLCASACIAAADPPLLATTFETNETGWQAINVTGQPTSATVSVTHDAASLKEGKGSLKFDYSIKKGDASILMLPAGLGTLTRMKSIHFWVKSDHSTSFMLVLSEKDGGRYQAIFAAAANQWQEVNVALTDFVLNQDADSPKDLDGKLDADQIEGIGLVDCDSFLAQMVGDNPEFISFPTGAHTTLISPFEASADPISPPPAVEVGTLNLTTLQRPQIDWVVLGNVSVSKSNGAPLTGASLKATYVQKKGKFSALLKNLAPGLLTGKTQVSLAVASKNSAALMLQVEDTDGNKFNKTFMAEAGSAAHDLVLKLSDFTTANDSKDPNAKLDLSKIKQFLLMDASGFADVTEAENTIWINHLLVK